MSNVSSGPSTRCCGRATRTGSCSSSTTRRPTTRGRACRRWRPNGSTCTRVPRFETQSGSSRARNYALDIAKGDVIAYLDDDNRFDPDWLRAVAWAFTEYPETQVAYGARVVDDDIRHKGLPGRSMPIVQFLAWDADAMMESNRVDQNVIAHRPSPARLDEVADQFTDWDLMLQLTDDCEPLELPAVAVHYYSDAPDRVTDLARARADRTRHRGSVRQRARERRADA